MRFEQSYWTLANIFESSGSILLVLFSVSALTCVAVLRYEHSVIDIPLKVLLPIPLGILTGVMHNWVIYRLCGGVTVRGFALKLLAINSLYWVGIISFFQAWFASKGFAFKRTSKFKEEEDFKLILSSVQWELFFATCCLAIALTSFVFSNGGDLLLIVALSFFVQHIYFMAAPILAMLAAPRYHNYFLHTESV